MLNFTTGIRAFPGVVAYNMSKAALDHLVRSCALEVAAQGVRGKICTYYSFILKKQLRKNA